MVHILFIYKSKKSFMKYTKNDIRNFPTKTGVYKISFSNSTNGKVYIGSAAGTKNKIKIDNGFHIRWKSHIYQLSKNKSQNTVLQNAANKYGINNILFEIIEECDPIICLEREQYYIDTYNSYNNGYNSRPIASNNGGLIMSSESKIKMKKTYKEKRNVNYEEIKKLYDSGKSTREISNELHMSRNTIRKIFSENEIITRKDKGQKKKMIYQYDMVGNLIDKFDSITECARKLNINKQGIKIVLSGRCKHYNNMYYNFEMLSKEEVIEKINYLIVKSKNRKYFNIKQIDENEHEIKVWRDVKEIVDFYTGMNSKGVRKSITENIKYKNYYWKL